MLNRLKFEWSLADRFLKESKGQTALITTGIAIGVAVMVFLSALIDGLQADLIDNTVGNSPHITVTNTESARIGAFEGQGPRTLIIDSTQSMQKPMVEWQALEIILAQDNRTESVLPVVEGSGLVRRGQTSRGIVLRGFDLTKADQIYDITSRIVAGSKTPNEGAVLIGKDLADNLGVNPGDPIFLELPGKEPLALTIDSIFSLGTAAVDERWVIVGQQKAGALLGLGDQITSMEVQVKDVFTAEEMARTMSKQFPNTKWVSWQETNASLLVALQSQSSSSYTIQFFVLLAVILGVSSVLAISAVQKSKEIGILKAIGIRTSSIARVFLIQGALLGVLGVTLGFGLGLGMSIIFITFAGTAFTLLLKPLTMFIILSATMISATLSAYLPARQVSQLNPIEVIRNG
ncbi:ABC-type transport system, involved in lipoprotein release, permease component [Desulfitobacterium dichloroeliminans LMG P-21439]|uniref:ABC-type transport system, involved in lipoprotein release, permease component n=1 Tax=Desulfitobacterium dichloroeliminans (strain LMG P-21439 / DCA1) TaxID=871963 RepID=L0F4D7_DESDL|nr:ABC transporter permease [Desulfitobacterium dichloroeliminans]AGA67808.1 ABC-type transport system, involved in lipoprotein release, permease component [Desulfitobacterium dichloroeliminans LMG P-21439]